MKFKFMFIFNRRTVLWSTLVTFKQFAYTAFNYKFGLDIFLYFIIIIHRSVLITFEPDVSQRLCCNKAVLPHKTTHIHKYLSICCTCETIA